MIPLSGVTDKGVPVSEGSKRSRTVMGFPFVMNVLCQPSLMSVGVSGDSAPLRQISKRGLASSNCGLGGPPTKGATGGGAGSGSAGAGGSGATNKAAGSGTALGPPPEEDDGNGSHSSTGAGKELGGGGGTVETPDNGGGVPWAKTLAGHRKRRSAARRTNRKKNFNISGHWIGGLQRSLLGENDGPTG